MCRTPSEKQDKDASEKPPNAKMQCDITKKTPSQLSDCHAALTDILHWLKERQMRYEIREQWTEICAVFDRLAFLLSTSAVVFLYIDISQSKTL